MIPKELEYPEFVANQVLQKSHLNALFDYLDENNRLTRTNLLGIGIVCGLEVIPINSNQIKITKGCGVTSAGYLVTFGEKNGVLQDITYSSAKTYLVPEDVEYPQLFDSATKQNRFELWELMEATAAPNPAPPGFRILDANFLNPANAGQKKVVMIFVELLQNVNKNCSPISCDDKGANISVFFRPLLIKKSDADILLAEVSAFNGAGSYAAANSAYTMADMRLRRFDVPATALSSAADIVQGYKNILTQSFIESTLKVNLNTAYTEFGILLNGINNDIGAFTPPYNAGKIELPNPWEYQYFYDFIYDLMEVYEEIKRLSSSIMPVCCPDERLFPRHLFLGLATENTSEERSDYRHYFIPSPILSKGNKEVKKLRSLFRKLMIMLKSQIFKVPSPANTPVKITPSKLGTYPISAKAIPYYYQIDSPPHKLYEYWNFRKTELHRANQNMAYFSNLYNPAGPDFVQNPLLYDLEPYNFLRIEGHVGYDFRQALKQISDIRDLNRLPFDVVAIQTGETNYNALEIKPGDCHFSDLEINWDVTRREWESIIGKVIEYLDDRFEEGDLISISSNINQQAKELRAKLILSKTFMVNDLPNFYGNYWPFINLYEDIEIKSKKLRADLLKQNRKDETLLEDLIDHVDELIQAEHKGPFRAIYQEYKRRFDLMKSQLALATYARSHPGLQHKGGVPMGGTFILVYDGQGKTSAQPVIADFYLPYRCCSDCSPGQVVIMPPEQQPDDPVPTPEIKETENGCKGNTYVFGFEISEGTGPYKVFVDNVLESTTNQSTVIIQGFSGLGQHTVHIEDNNGQMSNILFMNVVSCCDFPCDGNMLDCEYFFIPRPKQDKSDKYEVRLNTIFFNGTDMDGKPLQKDKSNINEPLLNGGVNQENYPEFAKALLEKLQALLGADELPQELIQLTYEEKDQDFESIRIRRWECHEFAVEIAIKINDDPVFFIRFDSAGTTVSAENEQYFIPKFNCIRVNQCADSSEELCKQKPEVKDINYEKLTATSGRLMTSPPNLGAQFLWLINGKSVEPEVSNLVQPVITHPRDTRVIEVQVFVFSKGCLTHLRKTVPLG